MNRCNSIYKTGHKKKDKTSNFQKFKTIRSFGREIYNNDLSLDDALELQIRLKDDINIFKESTKPKESIRKEKKALTLKNVIILLNGRQKLLHDFENGMFPTGKQEKRHINISYRVASVGKVS